MKLIIFLTQLLFLCKPSVQKSTVPIDERTALLLIDIQYCFLKNGSLAVEGGNDIIPIVNDLRNEFEHIILTQDWHCVDHVSFASVHPGTKPFENIKLEYDVNGNLCNVKEPYCDPSEVRYEVDQTLWPDHCVKNERSSQIHPDVDRNPESDIIVRKGFNCAIDSYSAFYDNGGISETQLNDKLRSLNVNKLYITGLALDYCVFYSATDAKELGYDVYVVRDATRGITDKGIKDAIKKMEDNGINIIYSTDILGERQTTEPGRGHLMKSSFSIILLVSIVPVALKYM